MNLFPLLQSMHTNTDTRPAAQAFVEQNARTAWGLSRDRARPPTVQKAGFPQHSHPCQTFGVAATPIFFKTTQFSLFACQVVRDPQERGGAAAAARQVDLLAADRTSQHRVDVKYVEVMEAGCFRKVSLPLPIHAAYADRVRLHPTALLGAFGGGKALVRGGLRNLERHQLQLAPRSAGVARQRQILAGEFWVELSCTREVQLIFGQIIFYRRQNRQTI